MCLKMLTIPSFESILLLENVRIYNINRGTNNFDKISLPKKFINYKLKIFLLICLFSICFVSIMLLSNNFYVNAADTRYVQQDNDKNLINLLNLEENHDEKYDFINLRSASYFIGRNYLNVTLWIKSFNALTSMNSLNGSIIYGI